MNNESYGMIGRGMRAGNSNAPMKKMMYRIIERFREDTHDSGLIILDSPTGSGKTHISLDSICDGIDRGRRYFFVTTLKKNLPEEQLREMFERRGKLELFNKKFLRIPPYYEGVIKAFDNGVVARMSKGIKETKEYKNLAYIINQRNKYIEQMKSNAKTSEAINEDDFSDNWYSTPLDEQIRGNAEPAFRRTVMEGLKGRFRSAKLRTNAVKNDPDWQWVAELYPSFHLMDNEYQIIFMSMDKFLLPISTIVEPAKMLYDTDIIKNAVIFVDEFDATKDTMLKNSIAKCASEKVDVVGLFCNIYSILATHCFPEVFNQSLTNQNHEKGPGKRKANTIDEMLDNAGEIFDCYYLNYSFNADLGTERTEKQLLFYDGTERYVMGDDVKSVTYQTKKERGFNEISFLRAPYTDVNGIDLLGMLKAVRGFILDFVYTAKNIALGYQKIQNEIEEGFTFDEAVSTVLKEFGIDGEYVQYMTNQIMNREETEDISEVGNRSFYENGLQYYTLERSASYNTKTKIIMHSFDLTPEKMLLRFCLKAKVIGLSATGNIQSVIGNFDQKYLNRNLGGRFVKIKKEERDALHREYLDTIRGYSNVNVHVGLKYSGDHSEGVYRGVIKDDELADELFEMIERSNQNKNGQYDKQRYFRVAQVIQDFLIHDDIKSFLCLMTKHPTVNDPNLDLNVIKALFNKIAAHYNKEYSADSSIEVLTSQGFEATKQRISDKLAANEKVFVFSTYQTVGAGQNLQYPVPKELENKIVKINDRSSMDGVMYKDFDAIYLEKPTYLVPLLKPEISEEDFIKFLVCVEMLLENGEITDAVADKCIRNAFKCFYDGLEVNRNDQGVLYGCHSVKLLATKIIIQAIGRMCRTCYKSSDIYIFVDANLLGNIDTSICNEQDFNYEFTELAKVFDQAWANQRACS